MFRSHRGDVAYARFVAGCVKSFRDSISTAPNAESAATFAGMWRGMVEASFDDGPAVPKPTRTDAPPPPSAGSVRFRIGVRAGGLLATLAHQDVARGRSPRASLAENRGVGDYAATLTTSSRLEVLVQSGDVRKVLAAHAGACVVVERHGHVLDLETEIDMAAWLLRDSGVAVPVDLGGRVGELRKRRQAAMAQRDRERPSTT